MARDDPALLAKLIEELKTMYDVQVEALRDVAAGEELKHAYVDVTRPAQVRAAALAGFGFKCDCEKCARAFGG